MAAVAQEADVTSPQADTVGEAGTFRENTGGIDRPLQPDGDGEHA